MLRVRDLTVAYDDLTALSGVDLDVEAGEFVTVVGPSGCGKTTLLRAVGGLTEPTAGTVAIDGDDPATARAAGRLGVVFQEHALLPWKSAMENVVFLRRMAGKPPDEAGAREALATVGLEGFEGTRPGELSGGMKQRVAIARAIHLGADVLLMDEPFGELDELTREEMGVEIRRLWRALEATVVFVTHSIPEAVLLGDRCLGVRGPPGELAWEREISLPRPRDRSVFESTAFAEEVAATRRLFHDHTAEGETPER